MREPLRIVVSPLEEARADFSSHLRRVALPMKPLLLALPLLLLAASAGAQTTLAEDVRQEAERNRTLPDEARVSEAAKSPETLWALIIDPSTRYDDRMRAAEKAKDVLPPRYIAKQASAQLALEEERWKHQWWVRRGPVNALTTGPAPRLPETVARTRVLGFEWVPPAEPLDYPTSLAELRRAPWPWQVERALERVEIPIGSARGFDVVRDLPCATYSDETVVLNTLKRFPMTAETYGVVRNALAPKPDSFLESSLPEWWAYRQGDDWHAAQAFIVAMAPKNETTGAMVTSEAIATTSSILYGLEKMIQRMHDGPFPYTAFLALANRIDEEPLANGNDCLLAYDASRLVQVLDPPLVAAEPAFKNADGCRAWLADFHEWLRTHGGELEAGAAAERVPIANARSRMNQVSLCRLGFSSKRTRE